MGFALWFLLSAFSSGYCGVPSVLPGEVPKQIGIKP
jgi:hypothetical protein